VWTDSEWQWQAAGLSKCWVKRFNLRDCIERFTMYSLSSPPDRRKAAWRRQTEPTWGILDFGERVMLAAALTLKLDAAEEKWKASTTDSAESTATIATTNTCDSCCAISRFRLEMIMRLYACGRKSTEVCRKLPPKNWLIALWSATNHWYVVKCVSQKRNQSNNQNQWYDILVTFIYKFSWSPL